MADSTSKPSVKVLRVRVRDKHARVLRAMAREVNTVWNYSNELSYRSINERNVWLSGFALDKYTTGAAAEFEHVGSATIQEVAQQYAAKRRAARRSKLRWRVSNPDSPRYSLGWVPFKARAAKWVNGQVRFAGHFFNVWDSYGLSRYAFRAGSFSEDARGRWYFNICIEAPAVESAGRGEVGIDLGLKDFAALSTGEVVARGNEYRNEEAALAVAQRARKKKRVKAIHAKIANRRKDRLHKLSHRLTRDNSLIVVGNVNASAMAKSGRGKSVFDAGWSAFRTMLEYKAEGRQAVFIEVDESFSTQTCSGCGALGGPKGLEGLVIREWSCLHCGDAHHRDVNAARNILAAGHGRLAVGIPAL